MKIPKEKYNEITRINREQIKETLSGCPDLEAQRFLQCMVDFNMIISLVNQHANCDLKNFRELETILDKNMGGKFHEKNKALKDCMTIDFSRCGFKFEKIAQDK